MGVRGGLTFYQMLMAQRGQRAPRHNEEHEIQSACVTWFRLQYPQYRLSLFAVPNGTYKATHSQRRQYLDEGLLSGVSDLILLVPSRLWHALLIEMKTQTGRVAGTQRAFGEAAERNGYKYAVCRSLDEFMQTINDYLGLQ